MYRYSGCKWPFAHRITGDGYQRLMDCLSSFPKTPYDQQQKWTDEDVEYLIEMYRKNLRFDFIAEVLGRPIGSIRKKIVFLHRDNLLEQRPNIQSVLFKKRNEYIKRHYLVRGVRYCSRHLGLAKSTIEVYAGKMRLKSVA